MRVNPHDGRCRSCGGPLDIIDACDDALVVACADCGETYDVETDAFGDGCMTYWPEAMTEKLREDDHDA